MREVNLSEKKYHKTLSTPFPGIIAHHDGLFHGEALREATVEQGKSSSSYFQESGISACAEKNGGICTFWMGDVLAIYQITNKPLVYDEFLAPSTDTNRELFGDFMGSLHINHPERQLKRLIVERSLGSQKFVEALDTHIRQYAHEYLSSIETKEMAIDDFAMSLVTHVDSHIPGVLDFTQVPLTRYIASEKYRKVVLEFFNIASDVITNVNPNATSEFDMIVPFIRELLLDNFKSIASAPKTNLILQYFSLWKIPFNPDEISKISPEKIKEIGTIIIATYDTTTLSLIWAITYLESSSRPKEQVIFEARNKNSKCPFSTIDQAVLEAIRLGGSNPTALWRRTIKSFTIEHVGQEATIPVGTMFWLDRWQSNRDPETFPDPHSFNLQNICTLNNLDAKVYTSLLARNRYEINSFSMVNTIRNPRKCPGRLFSVRMQSILLREIYSRYDVLTRDIDLQLKPYSSMPRPSSSGFITITPRSTYKEADDD